MGADIYDWERVHGKGSYQALIDGGCSGDRHQAGCSHGVAPHVWPAAAALEAAWEATKGKRIDAEMPQETAQRADFLVAALRAAWGAVGERAEKAENKLAALRSVLLEGGQDAVAVRRRALAIIGADEKGGDPDDDSFDGPVL